jgi:hypothetical protein
MKWNLLAVFLVLGTCLTVAVQNSVGGDTVERDWIQPDTDITLEGRMYLQQYLRVNTSDMVTINLKNGTVPMFNYIMIGICTNHIFLNYSGVNRSTPSIGGLCETNQVFGSPPYPMIYYAQNGNHSRELWAPVSAPQNFWMTVASDDILMIFIITPQGDAKFTFNVTVSPDPNGVGAISRALSDRVAELTDMLDAANAQIGVLGAELQRQNDTPPNQTFINQTFENKTEVRPVTYVNKTMERSSAADFLVPAVTGILGGIIGGFATAIVMSRRKKP